MAFLRVFAIVINVSTYMSTLTKQNPLFLFLGDIVILFASLWLTLVIRYRELPPAIVWSDHLIPFSILITAWLLVFFIAGLYERRSTIFRQPLAGRILQAHISNSIIAVLFFYFIPYFGITPKTNLFIYLVISFVLILAWRLYGYSLLKSNRRQNAILVSSGSEMQELYSEVNTHDHYNLKFVRAVDIESLDAAQLREEIAACMNKDEISIIVIDPSNKKLAPILPTLYNLIFSNIMFIDVNKMYEDVFGRLPLSLITYAWLLEHVTFAPKIAYDTLKHVQDVVVALILGIVSLVLYPFIIIAIKMEDGGRVFITQSRVGQDGSIIKIHKFRTMTSNDDGNYVGGHTASANVITLVGNFLRKTRLDELPQLWNVVAGDLSLIGPRPEFPALVAQYEKEIPYYSVRHLIKPGLSGWAQLYHDNHPHHALAVQQTAEKLSYDLYYIKNRSLLLDITIALKTISKLLSRSGA